MQSLLNNYLPKWGQVMVDIDGEGHEVPRGNMHVVAWVHAQNSCCILQSIIIVPLNVSQEY